MRIETFLNAYPGEEEAITAAADRAVRYGRDFDVRRDGSKWFAVPRPRPDGNDHAALAYIECCGGWVATIPCPTKSVNRG